MNRFTSWRKSTLISLAKNLIIRQRIKTLLRKAKAVKPLVEKLISLAKQNDLAAKRQAAAILNEHRLVSLLFREIGPRFSKRQGGYTRIIRLGARRGDNAQVVILELTEIKEKKITGKPKKEKEAKPKEEAKPEKPIEEKKPETPSIPVKERPPINQKPTKKFLGGLRNIFKKERDAL